MGGLRALWHDDEGSSTAEMAMLLAVVAVVGIWAWQTYGSTVADSSAHATRAIFGTDATDPIRPVTVQTSN